jgi:hypothetical protein
MTRNNNISRQEIKYAIREITHEPDEKLIERIQDYFHFYPEKLENLTDEKFKQDYIAMLYNYNYLHSKIMTSTTETEATGRIILEVLMKENGLNQEEINELLDRNCWRRATQFSVSGEDFAHYGNYKKKRINWKDKQERSLSVEEVLNIIENRVKDMEKLEKELEENKVLIEDLESEVEQSQEEASCHLDALEVAKDWRLRQLDEVNDNHGKETNKLLKQIEILQNTLLTKDKEIDRLNYLVTKELPALPKKKNKFKRLVNKIKNKTNQVKEITREKFQAFIVQKNK